MDSSFRDWSSIPASFFEKVVDAVRLVHNDLWHLELRLVNHHSSYVPRHQFFYSPLRLVCRSWREMVDTHIDIICMDLQDPAIHLDKALRPFTAVRHLVDSPRKGPPLQMHFPPTRVRPGGDLHPDVPQVPSLTSLIVRSTPRGHQLILKNTHLQRLVLLGGLNLQLPEDLLAHLTHFAVFHHGGDLHYHHSKHLGRTLNWMGLVMMGNQSGETTNINQLEQLLVDPGTVPALLWEPCDLPKQYRQSLLKAGMKPQVACLSGTLLTTLLPHLVRVERLQVHAETGFPYWVLPHLHAIPSLRSLNIWDEHGTRSDHKVVVPPPQLTSLTYCTYYSEPVIDLRGMTGLRELTVYFSGDYCQVRCLGLEDLINLEVLRYEDVTGGQRLDLPLVKFTSLRELRLEVNVEGDMDIDGSVFHHMPHLTVLDLSMDISHWDLSPLTQLQCLRVRGAKRLSSEMVDAIAVVPSLRMLSIDGPMRLIYDLCARLPNLELLQLPGSIDPLDPLDPRLAYCSHLKVIKVINAPATIPGADDIMQQNRSLYIHSC